jgi:glycosyltransferase involved in cell wall biosynthesis
VDNGETGLLVPPNDVAATARAIDAILGDPVVRQRMSEAGLRRVADYFSMEKYIERVVAVYEKAIAISQRLPDEFKDQTDWQTPQKPSTTGDESA